MFADSLSKVRDFFISIKFEIGIYLFWIVAHYVASHLYVRWCAPSTLSGFLLSAFIISTPHCKALRWTIGEGGQTLTSMWLVLGGWLSARILFRANHRD